MSPPPPPLIIVFNAASGSADALEASRRVAQRLTDAGRAHALHLVRDAKQLAATAVRAVHEARERHGVVIAAGGDGTLNTVAQAAWNADWPMGVLPQGTFNYFGRAHGMPADADAAVDVLLAAQVQSVTVGMLGDQVFLVNASVGLYPRLLEDRETAKKRFGRHRLVAMVSGFVTLLRGRIDLALQMQSHGQTRVVRARTLFVGNNPLQLEALGLPVADAVEDGALAAITLAPLPPLATLWLMLRGAAGRLNGADGVDSFAFQRLTVQPPRGQCSYRVAMDGEVHRMPSPLEFQVAPRPLKLLRPVAAPLPEEGAA